MLEELDIKVVSRPVSCMDLCRLYSLVRLLISVTLIISLNLAAEGIVQTGTPYSKRALIHTDACY